MITVIRERFFRSNWYKVVIWALVIILFLVFTLPSLLDKSVQTGSWVVKVNGQDVSYNDFVRKAMEVNGQIEMIKQQYGKNADVLLKRMGLEQDPQLVALEMLIREMLMNEAAAKLGVHIGKDYIIQKLADNAFVKQELADLIPAYALRPTGIDQELLKRYLKHIKMSQEQFDAKIKEALMRNVLSECAMTAFYVPLFEARAAYAIDTTSKKFSVLVFEHQAFVKEARKKEVSEQELQSFFDNQVKAGNYWVPEKRDALIYSFDPAGYGITVTEQEIEAAYEERKLHDFVQAPSSLEVRTILFAVPQGQNGEQVYIQAKTLQAELLKNPQLFAQKAKEVSQDTATAPKGGLMPAFAKGTQESSFDRAAFLLQHDGDISDVVRTSRGFEIIQRVSKSPLTFKPLKAVREQLHEQLLQAAFADKFAHDARSLADVDAFVKQHKGVMQRKDGMELDGQPLSQAVFGLAQGGTTLYMDNKNGVLVQLVAIHARHVLPLASIKQRVQEDFYAQLAQDLLQEKLKKAQKDFATKSLQETSEELCIKCVQTELLNKSDVGKLAVLRSQGLPIDGMFQMGNVNAVVVLEKDANYYLVKLNAVGASDGKGFEDKKSGILAELEPARRKIFGEGYVASLYRNATIKPNESFFNGSMGQQQSVDENQF